MRNAPIVLFALTVGLAAACGDDIDVGGGGNGGAGNGGSGNGSGGGGSGEWVHEVVDPAPRAALGLHRLPLRPVLAFAEGGRPEVVYYHARQEVLVHAARTTTGWTDSSVAQVAQHGRDPLVDAGHDFVVDGAGIPHVTYSDGEEAFYLRRDGPSWTPTLLGEAAMHLLGGASETRIALDTDGRPHILYQAPGGSIWSGPNVRYLRWTGAAWTDDDGPNQWPRGFAVDGGGIAHALRGEGDRIEHLRRSATAWTAARIAGSADYASGEMAIDGNDVPHVVFRRTDDDAAFYAHHTGGSWEVERIAESVPAVGRVWLAVGPDASVHVLLWNDLAGRLQYHRRLSGGGWSEAEVVFEDITWPTLSFRVGPDGTPAVAYYDYDEEKVMYAERR